MTVALRLLVVLTLLGQVNVPQTAKEVTTTIIEPGTYELAKLFQQADRVVLAKVVGGDTESYDVAVYKAEVVKNFKGGAAGETFYFGHSWERDSVGSTSCSSMMCRSRIAPKRTSNTGYGAIHYSEVFNEGYTAMETSVRMRF